MSPQGKLFAYILILSSLGLVLLCGVLFDSYQQAGIRLQTSGLEAHAHDIGAFVSQQAGSQKDSLEVLLSAASHFDSPQQSIFLLDPSGNFHFAGEQRDPGETIARKNLYDAIRSGNHSGFWSANNQSFVWSKQEVTDSAYQVVVVHPEHDKGFEHFISEFGVPLFVTIIVFIWITTWVVLILGSLFKKLNKQKALLEEQTIKVAEARDKALEASSAKGIFLANMSHEIRTPLTAIIGFSEALLSSDQTVEERIKSIHTINHSGKHLLQLINEILDLSKIEANKLQVELMEVSLIGLVQEIEPLMRMQAMEKGLAFNVNYSLPIPGTFTTDPTRLKQILLNLVSNAIKFTEQGYIQINVSCAPASEQISFEVIDTGIGMSREQSQHVFNAFTQADSSTTRKYGGTGLGLTLSRQLSEMLGGSLTLQSEVGAGSHCKVTVSTGSLAAVKYLHEIETATAAPAFTPKPIPKNILAGDVLIVEDNEDNQRLLGMYVSKAGANASIAADGQQALDCVASKRFDLIFMDMQMPVMGGLEASVALRKQGYTGTIIALTANTMPEDRERCLAAGCDDFLSKPIDSERFFEMMARYLRSTTRLEVCDPVVSDLLDDPDMWPLIEAFIANLPEKMDKLENAAANTDWNTLQDIAHQLKGAGGGYGYADLSELAGKLEFQAISGNQFEVDSLIEHLKSHCRRIYAGARETQEIA